MYPVAPGLLVMLMADPGRVLPLPAVVFRDTEYVALDPDVREEVEVSVTFVSDAFWVNVAFHPLGVEARDNV